MGLRSIVCVGIYALIYLHTILGEGIVSRHGLPCGVLPPAILKIENYVRALMFGPHARLTDHKLKCTINKIINYIEQ